MPGFDDDDTILDLPPMPAEVDEASDSESSLEDFGLSSALDSGDENVGLDDSEGVEGFDPTEFVDLGYDAEEGALDATPAGDLIPASEGISEDETEYGWVANSDALDPSEWSHDAPLIEPLVALGDDYGGAVGLEGDDVELGELPPLNDSEDQEELAGDLELGLDDELEFGSLPFDDEVAASGQELPERALSNTTEVFRDQAGRALALSTSGVFSIGARGEQLYLWFPSDDEKVLEGADPETVADLAAFEDSCAVGLPGGRVGQSTNGEFRWLKKLPGKAATVLTRVCFDATGRLFAWTGGGLYRFSGAQWIGPVLPFPVLDLIRRDESLFVLTRQNQTLQILRSSDGYSFTPFAPPVPCNADVPGFGARLDIRGDCAVMAIKGSAPQVLEPEGRGWQPLAIAAPVHRAFFDGEDILMAVHTESSDRGAIVRWRSEKDDMRVEVDLSLVLSADANSSLSQRIREFGADSRYLYAACEGALVRWKR